MLHRSLSTLALTALLATPALSFSLQAKPQDQTQRKHISSWSQNIEQSMIFLKLDNPSVLEYAALDKTGNLKVSSELLQKIISEQDKLEQELLALSPEIKVLFRYRFVMNGLTIVAPSSLYETILNLRPVKALMEPVYFHRPEPMRAEVLAATIKEAQDRLTTTDLIGASKVHSDYDIKGQGIHVGIIDSGIDYTHCMFGGPGTVEAFSSVNPLEPTELFPNEKVVGGFDFVGDVYNPGSILSEIRIPRPDSNPIDMSGHGTHVAGTVAGIGCGEQSYDGIAPQASLHALKVFAPRGGTSDLVVMAAMEYAVDPNGDLDPTDRLHVLNLSLGGVFGKPNNNYREAIRNLARAGVTVTASAGNSGAIPYVVGSPSTADIAMSVGASIDAMLHNWRFDSVEYRFADGETKLIEVVEGPITKPQAQAKGVKGKLVDIGLGNEPLTDEQKEALRGNVALISRGGEPFTTKLTNAVDGGAIGVIMRNNQPGNPIPMGGEGSFDIPGVMVDQEFGEQLLAKVEAGEEVIADFDSGRYVEQPEVIDTLASFSSQGPRSEDSRLKPEIIAPGYQIFSAQAGSGNRAVPMNGTSMSAPQMAGVMALMRQAFPTLSVNDLQGVVMNTARNMKDAEGNSYTLSRQGAGLVQVDKAISSRIVTLPKAFSLSEHRLGSVESPVVLEKTLTLRQLHHNRGQSSSAVEFKVEWSKNMKVILPEGPVSLNSKLHTIRFELTQEDAVATDVILNHEAIIQVLDADTKEILARVPALAVGLRASNVLAQRDGNNLNISNPSAFAGQAWPMNLLSRGQRHPDLGRDADNVSTECNLLETGYRIMPATPETGPATLDFGFVIDKAVTRWEACTVIVLFSTAGGTGDYEEADLEIVGSSAFRISDLGDVEIRTMYNSLLFDASLSRELRAEFEQKILEQGSEQDIERPDYSKALLDMRPMFTREHGRQALVSVTYSNLINALREKGMTGNEVYYRIGILNNTNSAYKYDSFTTDTWQTLSLDPAAQAFVDLPMALNIPPGLEGQLPLTPGTGTGDVLVLTPDNL
jgi:minor extracellular serine protease Vpr